MIGIYIPEAEFSPAIFTEFLVGSFLLLFFSYRIGMALGSKLQVALDSTEDLSYVCFNKGDEKQIEEISRKNRKSLFVASTAFGFNFVIAIVTSLIANYLSK